MENLLNEIILNCSEYCKSGKVASYIPELSKANPSDFGICIANENGELFFAGDFDKRFTIQSIIKPLILLLALEDNGVEAVNSLCGVEATGKPFDAFNYSDRALTKEHINPMINAGAIALCTMIKGVNYEEKFSRLFELAKRLSGNDGLKVNTAVYKSEKSTGSKNRALAYMLKAYNLISDDAEDVLDMYFKACSIEVSCKDLAKIAFVLANHGKGCDRNGTLITDGHARYVNAIMAICGMYDGSGEFALKVGIPAKSGVGGGIMGCVPHRMGIGIYAPALDSKGNSVAGIKALEALSRELKLSIF